MRARIGVDPVSIDAVGAWILLVWMVKMTWFTFNLVLCTLAFLVFLEFWQISWRAAVRRVIVRILLLFSGSHLPGGLARLDSVAYYGYLPARPVFVDGPTDMEEATG